MARVRRVIQYGDEILSVLRGGMVGRQDDGCAAYATDWRVPGDFPTIQAALESASVQTGDVIVVSAGSHAGAYVAKSVEIRGEGGAIISGPAHPSGLIMGFRLLDFGENRRVGMSPKLFKAIR